jgi:hypothetical protein
MRKTLTSLILGIVLAIAIVSMVIPSLASTYPIETPDLSTCTETPEPPVHPETPEPPVHPETPESPAHTVSKVTNDIVEIDDIVADVTNDVVENSDVVADTTPHTCAIDRATENYHRFSCEECDNYSRVYHNEDTMSVLSKNDFFHTRECADCGYAYTEKHTFKTANNAEYHYDVQA